MPNEILLKSVFETGAKMRTIDLGYPIYASAFLPYSKELLVAGGGGGSKSGVKNAINVFKVLRVEQNIIPKFSFSTGANAVMLLQQSSLQEQDVICGVNNECVLYKTSSNELLEKKRIQIEIGGSDGYITAFHQSSSFLLLGTSDGAIWPIKFPSFKILPKLQLSSTDEIFSVRIDKNGSFAVCCTIDTLYLVDLALSKVTKYTSSCHTFEYRCVCWLPGEEHFLAVSNSIKRDRADISTFDKSFNMLRTSKLTCRPITCITIKCPNNDSSIENQNLCIFGTADGSLGVLKLQSLSLKMFLGQLQDFPMTSVTTDHQASLIFATSANGTISVLTLENKSKLRLIIIYLTVLLLAILFYYIYNK